MPRNRDAGLRASQTNKEKYGADFYQRIGAIGGRNGNTGGLYGDPVRARELGSKGGSISKRGYKFLGYVDGKPQYEAKEKA